VQVRETSAHRLDGDDADAIELRRGGYVLLDEAADGLGGDDGEEGGHDDGRRALSASAAAEGEERGETGEDAGDGEVGAAERRDGEVGLAALEAGEPLVGELPEGLGGYVAVDVEAIGGGAAEHADGGAVPAKEDGDGGVLQGVVAADAFEYSFYHLSLRQRVYHVAARQSRVTPGTKPLLATISVTLTVFVTSG
jgi:hypothetical protein